MDQTKHKKKNSAQWWSPTHNKTTSASAYEEAIDVGLGDQLFALVKWGDQRATDQSNEARPKQSNEAKAFSKKQQTGKTNTKANKQKEILL